MPKILYDKSKSSTRSYDIAAGKRIAIGAAGAVSTAFDAVELLLHPSSRCFVIHGPAVVAGTPLATGVGIPLEAGEKFHLQIAPGDLVAVVRDTADGFLHIIPVN